MLRVLVAEDSVTARHLLVEILRSDPEIAVVGEAGNGRDAIAMTRALQPDVVTMDIRMPQMDGFEATRRIMIETPTPIVIISSLYDGRDVEFSMRALREGALAVLTKPSGPPAPGFSQDCQRLVQTVKAMAQVKVVRRWAEQKRIEPPLIPLLSRTARTRIVAMVSSTGGPAAVARILSDLPASYELPVLIVQHIGAGFVDGFAAWLNTQSAIAVRVARDGDPLRPATVYIAQDDSHLEVRDQLTIAISRTPPVGGFRPSGSVLFESVASTFGSSTVAVVLTGMGEDGVAGLRAVRTAGGQILVQDESTSVVFGMPGAAVAAGLADLVLPIGAIGSRLQALAQE